MGGLWSEYPQLNSADAPHPRHMPLPSLGNTLLFSSCCFCSSSYLPWSIEGEVVKFHRHHRGGAGIQPVSYFGSICGFRSLLGIAGVEGGEVSSVGLLHDGLCPPSEEDLRARWRLPCRGRKNIVCFAELIFLKFRFPCWKMGCRWAQHPSLPV